jgi:PAS domain S-box-containing protein
MALQSSDSGIAEGTEPSQGMAGLIQRKDWSATPLGSPESWSPSLRLIISIMTASGFPMAVRWGPDFILIYNDGYRPILADKHPWALGLPFREVWPEVVSELIPLHEEILAGKNAGVFSEDRPLTIRRHGMNWETAHFTVSYSPIPDDTSPTGVGGVLVTAVETTNRLRTEAALQRLNHTLESQIAERTRERNGVWRVTSDLLGVANFTGRLLSVNPAWTAILGWSEQELLEMDYRNLRHPDDRARTAAEIALSAGGINRKFENRYLHKDRSYRSIFWSVVPEDEVFYIHGRDITVEKQQALKLQQTADALRQSQKMEAIGQLTGGIAHDFNNLLQVVSGNLQLLQKDILGHDRAERRLTNAQAAVARGAKLTNQLLSFGRRQALEPKAVNIGRLVSSMDELLRRSLGEAIEIETIIAGGLWNTLIDPGNLENAIVNLAINARDAMQGTGKLTIEVGNAYLDEAYVQNHPEVEPGQYVMLCVTDTGGGMTPEIAARAFDPFFSTKPEGQGTGLGLSMVYGFAKQSHGHTKIYTEVGHGTTIKLYLPRVAQSEDIPAPVDLTEIAGGAETVLIVEDDDQVRATAIEMLGDLGYRVLKASDAAGALHIIESGLAIDLLFTDVVMPGTLKSPELARKARERQPNIAVLFTSGYTENAIVHGGRLDADVELLPKPYAREALARKVRQVLAKARQR